MNTFCYKGERGQHDYTPDQSSGGKMLRCTICGRHIVNLFREKNDEKKQKGNKEKTQQQEKEVK